MDDPTPTGRLTVVGDVGVDLVMGPVDGWPAIGTEVIVPMSETRLGGSAGNVLLAMNCLGADCRLISTTGKDMFGAWLTKEVEGLGGTLIPVDAPTTFTAAIVHECGERSFFTTRGHLEHVSWETLRPQVDKTTEGDIALLTGVFLLPKVRAAYPILLPELRRRGYTIALDTGWPSEGWTAEVRQEASGWLPHVDHLLLNEVELMHLAGVADVEQASAALSALLAPGATLVVKRGPQGALGLQDGLSITASAPEAVPFDTIGAGDSFNAGYLQARLSGRDLQASLQAGCTVASTIIARFPRHAIRRGELAAAIR